VAGLARAGKSLLARAGEGIRRGARGGAMRSHEKEGSGLDEKYLLGHVVSEHLELAVRLQPVAIYSCLEVLALLLHLPAQGAEALEHRLLQCAHVLAVSKRV
jgi:hypothetical protein